MRIRNSVLETNRFNLNVNNRDTCITCNRGNKDTIQCNNCKYYYHSRCTSLGSNEIMAKVKIYYCFECEKLGFLTKWLTQDFVNKAKQNFYNMIKRRYYFEVDKILNHRLLSKGRREFLIKWRYYKLSESTWEPEQHLDGAYSMLQNYCMKNQLTFSSIIGRVGATNDLRSNEDRYVDMEVILETIVKWMEYYYKNLNLTVQFFDNSKDQNGIYLIQFEQHCYTMYLISHLKRAFVADGNNLCLLDKVRAELQRITKWQLTPLIYDQQNYLDQCGSSAVLIALVMMKFHKSPSWPSKLTVPISWKKVIIKKIHNDNRITIDGESPHQIVWLKCQFCHIRKYREHENNKLILHERHCNKKLMNKTEIGSDKIESAAI